MHFTGKQRDTETNLDDFPARYYSSTQGRWLSPDWDAKPVSVPYAILGNPQTLNLYSYVGGGPTNHADPDGHADFAQSNSNNPCYNTGSADCAKAKAQEQKRSWWSSLVSTLAVGVARISPSAARKIYESANPGVKVPFDTVRQRYYDMAHAKALADGGTNAAENLKPQEHGEHMAEHMANGDFARWAGRAKDAAQGGVQEVGEAIKEGAQESAGAVREAATEVVQNPGEAIRDAATAVGEAVESGEIPPP